MHICICMCVYVYMRVCGLRFRIFILHIIHVWYLFDSTGKLLNIFDGFSALSTCGCVFVLFCFVLSTIYESANWRWFDVCSASNQNFRNKVVIWVKITKKNPLHTKSCENYISKKCEPSCSVLWVNAIFTMVHATNDMQLYTCKGIATFRLWRKFHFPYMSLEYHYTDVIMTTMASQITSLTIVYSTVYSVADQRKHQSSASLALCVGNSPGPVNSPHKGPVTRKMFPLDDVIMHEVLHALALPTLYRKPASPCRWSAIWCCYVYLF